MGDLEEARRLRVRGHERRVDRRNRARKTDRCDATAGYGNRENRVVIEDEVLNRFRSVRSEGGLCGEASEENGVSERFHI